MLKNITIALLCVFCINFTAKAQFTIDEDSLWTDGSYSDFDLGAVTKIRNATSNPDTIVWTRTTETLPTANWTSAVCDILLCHGTTENTAEFIMAPNTVGELSFHFYPGMDKGKGKMIVRFAQKSNPTNFIDVVINGQAYGLGVHSIANPAFRVFPNPASKTITIGNEKISEGSFEIFNILGEKVMNNTFTSAQKIDISALSKGVYIITIKNENAVASSKLVVE